MKRYVTLLFAFTSITFIVGAQNEELNCTILRDHVDQYYVVNSMGDSTLISKDEMSNYKIANNGSFQIVDGKGLKKDMDGVREKNKKYLVKNHIDTLLTIHSESERIVLNDSIYLSIIETEDGWQFIDESQTVVYDLELFWNHNKWKYLIRVNESRVELENLNTFILISLPRYAKRRSKVEDDDDFNFWFIMWLTTL